MAARLARGRGQRWPGRQVRASAGGTRRKQQAGGRERRGWGGGGGDTDVGVEEVAAPPAVSVMGASVERLTEKGVEESSWEVRVFLWTGCRLVVLEGF